MDDVHSSLILFSAFFLLLELLLGKVAVRRRPETPQH